MVQAILEGRSFLDKNADKIRLGWVVWGWNQYAGVYIFDHFECQLYGCS